MSRFTAMRRSVRTKIVALVLASTLLALALSMVALFVYAQRDYRQTHLAEVRTQAEILARASAAALAFNDRKEALQNLRVLDARPDFAQAALYGADGALFAAHARTGRPEVPPRVLAAEPRVEGDRLKLFHPVREAGALLGTVYLESEHRLVDRLSALAAMLAAVMAGMLAAAVLLLAWLQKVVTKPILALSSAANAVVERGDLSVRSAPSGEDEIGALTAAFNRMLGEIQRHTSALQESEERFRTIADSAPVLMWLSDESGTVFANRAYLEFVGADAQADVRGHAWERFVHADDHDDLTAAWQRCLAARATFDQELRLRRRDGAYRWMRAVAVPRFGPDGRLIGHTGCTFDVHEQRISSQALRDADRRKDEFLATLAHELRNPLAPIRSAVQVLGLDSAASSRGRIVSILNRQVSHMVRLVDDLIDISRVSRGMVELRSERLDIRQVMQTAAEISGPLMEQARHRFDIDLPGEPLWVDGDAVRLAQVFANLLNNAAKYTEPGGHIRFGVTRDAATAQVAVTDSGIGLDREELPRLFEMFSRANERVKRSQGGLGIGLSLAHRLVALHGGAIRAESPGRNRGSTFTVTLRLAAQSALPGRAPEPAQRPKQVPRQRLLIVDDNEDAAVGLALLLRTLGIHVEVAHSGRDALAALEQFAPEVVLLDLGMPDMDGLEVARRMRERRAREKLILIALTGWGQPGDRQRTKEAGFNHHLVKPVDLDALHALLVDSD